MDEFRFKEIHDSLSLEDLKERVTMVDSLFELIDASISYSSPIINNGDKTIKDLQPLRIAVLHIVDIIEQSSSIQCG